MFSQTRHVCSLLSGGQGASLLLCVRLLARQAANSEQPLNLSGRLAGVHRTVLSTCFLFVTFNNKKLGI